MGFRHVVNILTCSGWNIWDARIEARKLTGKTLKDKESYDRATSVGSFYSSQYHERLIPRLWEIRDLNLTEDLRFLYNVEHSRYSEHPYRDSFVDEELFKDVEEKEKKKPVRRSCDKMTRNQRRMYSILRYNGCSKEDAKTKIMELTND